MGTQHRFPATPPAAGRNQAIMENQSSNDHDSSTPGTGSQAEFSSSQTPREASVSAGALIRNAREKAGIATAKVCSELRLSPATLAAIEAGDYSTLAGPAYVRATLMSLSRYLRIDSREILKAYAGEAGEQEAAPATVSPYKDDSGTHAKAHKQIFILVLAVLLFILLLIMGKVNTSSPEPEPQTPVVTEDTLLNLEPLSDSTALDSLSDSLGVRDSSSAAAAASDSIARADSVTKAKAKAAAEAVSAGTHVRVTALTDSVWLRVLPAGARESSRYLRLDKPMEFKHDEAITFITRTGGTVRVLAGDNEKVPVQRRFKVVGNEITE